jgi:hypothetical protein
VKSSLASLQRGLLALIKADTTALIVDDPYLDLVRHSHGLQVVREITQWWKLYQAEAACPLTARALKKHDGFESSMRSFARQRTMSSYVESFSDDYLTHVRLTSNGFCSTVAHFEQCLLRVKRGGRDEYTIEWECEPFAALGALLSDGDLRRVPQGKYRTRIGSRLPNLCEVEPLQS